MKLLLFHSINILLISILSCDYIQSPIVSIEMSEAGFHRDLQYSVQFDYPFVDKDCEYALEQSFPAAVYVSVDQLDDLKRLGKLNAVYPKFVNIEAPTEKALGFSILFKGTPKITDNIHLPIHFRYHAPRSDRSYVTVYIDHPSIYVRCRDDELFLRDTNIQISPTDYCLNADTISFTETSLDRFNNCDWKKVNASIRLKSPLSANIPVGNKDAYPAVLVVTIVLSWVVSLWTIFSTRDVPRRINQKLEELRKKQAKLE